MKIALFSALFIGVISVLEQCSNPDQDPEITCSVSVDTGGIDNFVAVDVSIKNNLGRDVRYLPRYNPFSKNDEVFFEVSGDNGILDYHGYIYKYLDPTVDDTQEFKAGEILTTSYPLSDYYDFSNAGSFTVKTDISLNILVEETTNENSNVPDFEKVDIDCAPFTVVLSQALDPPPLLAATLERPPRLCRPYSGFPRGRCKPVIGSKCAQSVGGKYLTDTHGEMFLRVAKAMRAIGNRDPKVQKWFGNLNSQQLSFVEGNYAQISKYFLNRTVQYLCIPNDSRCIDANGAGSVIAFVYPSLKFADIHICSGFSSFPAGGTTERFETRAGILIHEFSHLPPTFTEDYVYGVDQSLSLAARLPSFAIRNADNYQYFFVDVDQ